MKAIDEYAALLQHNNVLIYVYERLMILRTRPDIERLVSGGESVIADLKLSPSVRHFSGCSSYVTTYFVIRIPRYHCIK